MNPDTILRILTLLATITGGLFALYQWHCNVQLNKARFLFELLNTFYNDKENRKWNMVFDYENEPSEDFVLNHLKLRGWKEENWINKNHKDHKILESLDSYLYFVNYLLYLKDHKLLSEEEFRFFEYDINNLATSTRLEKYTNKVHNLKLEGDFTCNYPFGYMDKMFPDIKKSIKKERRNTK